MSSVEVPEPHSLLFRSLTEYREHPDALREDYNVDPRWLPLVHRSYNGFEVLYELRDWIDDRPVTAEIVMDKQLASRVGKPSSKIPFSDIMLIHGWWPVRTSSRGGTHYANPEYCHGHEGISDLDEREKILRQAAGLAVVDPEDLCPAFGIKSTSIMKVIGRTGFQWGEHRQRARTRMARTWQTLNELGYIHQEIGEAFGLDRRSVGDWIRNYATDDPLPLDPALYHDLEVRR